MVYGTPAVFALSFVTWRKHRTCPLARGALALAVVEFALLLLWIIAAAMTYVSGSQNESHFGRAIRAILRAVNRSFGSSLSLSPYPWRARGIASKVISYTCRSIGSG